MGSKEDHEEISRVIQLYIDGAREGDAAKLREAFHPDARMFGSVGSKRFDVPIAELFAMSDGKPADVGGSYKARVASIDQIEDAAAAHVQEAGYWGSVSFTDFFTLARVDGRWWIVNKTFAYTGGELPAA